MMKLLLIITTILPLSFANVGYTSNFYKDFLMDVETGNFTIEALNCSSTEEPEIMEIDNNGTTKFDNSFDDDDYSTLFDPNYNALLKNKYHIKAENRDKSIFIATYKPLDNEETYDKEFVIRKNEASIWLEGLEKGQSSSVFALSDKGEIVVGWSIRDNKRLATIWFYELNNGNSLYHPYALNDFNMHNYSKTLQEVLPYTDFTEILKVSPNGKNMIVSAEWKAETPDRLKQPSLNNFYGTSFYTLRFGSNVKLKMEDVTAFD